MKFKVLKIVLSVMGGVALTYASVFLPFDGPEVLGVGGCGHPSGLPFSFIRTWKYLPEGVPVPFCSSGFDYSAFVLDVMIWFAVIFFGLFYLDKVLKRISIKNNDAKE